MEAVNSETTADKLSPGLIKDTLGAIPSFFTTIYGMVLVISMSYNIGYFKFINPQIVDMMTLGDYVDDTAHNLWLFLFAALLFFCSSLAYFKKKIGHELPKITLFGIFAFVSSTYFLLRGTHYSKFWPTVKIFLGNPSSVLIIIAVGITAFINIAFIVRRLLRHSSKDIDVPASATLSPIVIFLFIILAPYLGGMIQGYTESQYLTKDDYKIQSVDIVSEAGSIFKDVFIIKKLDKGLVIRNFNQPINGLSRFAFLNWSIVKSISYQDVLQAEKNY